MRRGVALALVLAAIAAASASAGGRRAAAPPPPPLPPDATYTAYPGHRIVAFSLDYNLVALAEDPIGNGCPLVIIVREPSPHGTALTTANGPTCRFGGHFWVRAGIGARIISNALDKALWIVRNGSSAEAIKGDAKTGETVLQHVEGIGPSGPFLGPVVGRYYLRLFADYTLLPDGTEDGGVISGNNRELWTAVGPVPAVGLDHVEHIVSVGADGSISMWHAHGARYGNDPNAQAAAAALDSADVFVLRSDRPEIDELDLDGTQLHSWRIAPGALPLLSVYVPAKILLYIAGNAVHELRLDTGRDSVIARAPAGARMVDARISRNAIAYLALGGAAGHGEVVVLPLAS